MTSVEGITEYELGNGLRVLLFPDNSKQTFTVNITYLVGSRHEGAGESGMAHLLEHMLFKGTPTHNGGIMKELSERGADFNGTTWYDRTNYFETMEATGDNLRWALELESDRMVNSRVSKEDLDSEMTVVRNEFERGENNPVSVLEERVLSTAYLWHSYGRSTIGSRSDIENVPIDRLQAFYRKYYQPDNAVLIIAGNFDPTETLPLVNELFGKIPRPERVLTETYTREPPQDGEREVTLRRVGDNQALMLAYHIPAASHPDSAAFDVLSFILGDEPSGRLYKALIETKLATGVSTGEYELHDPGVFLVQADMLESQDFQTAEDAVLRVIDNLADEPPTEDEVNRAKTRILTNFELAMNNSQRVALNLSESIASGDWRLMFLGRDDLEKVTVDDVVAAAQKYLIASNRTIGRFFPTETTPPRADIPEGRDLESSLNGYEGRGPIQQGEEFDPSPKNIESRVTRLTLPSGIKMVLLPKKTRGATVVAQMQLHWGTLESLTGKGSAPGMAGALLMRGTELHNRQELQDEMTRIKAQIGVRGGVAGASASVNTVRDGLPEAIRLVAEILKQPTFPESDFEEIKQSSIASQEARRSEPSTIAGTARNKHFSPYPLDDPRAALSVDESLERIRAVTLAQAKQFYQDFYGASDMEVAVVGDFDPKQVEDLVEDLFGDWKSPKPYARITEDYMPIEAVDDALEAPDKANAYLYAMATVPMNQQNPDYPYVYLANVIFGQDTKSRVWRRIREQDGLSYGTNTGFSADARDELATFSLGSTFAPENIIKVEDAFKDELQKLITGGFTDDEVQIAKDAFLQERQIGRSSDNSLAGLFLSQAELGRTMQREIDLEEAITNATPQQLHDAFVKWIKPEAISYFKAGDWVKAGVDLDVNVE